MSWRCTECHPAPEPAGTKLEEGQPIRLAVDLTQLKLFELESGAVIG